MAILQALTTGQLLDRVFSLYRKNFFLFATIAVVPQFCYLLIVMLPLMGIRLFPGGTFAMIGTAVVGFIVYMGAMALSQGATTVAVSGLYLEQPTSAMESFRQTFPMTLRLVGLMIGYGLLCALGFMLLIVPGVYFLVTYALSTAVMAIEKVSFSEAMSRSKDLVAGNRGRIAVIILLSFVITYAVAFGIAFPVGFATALLGQKMPILSSILNMLVQVIAGTIATPIGLIGFTLAYYDARVRKEAFDLHHMMETEAAASAAAAASSAGA